MARISKAQPEQELKTSPVLGYMIEQHMPLTREIFLSLAYMGDVPELLGVEEEAELPNFLQNWRVRHAD